MKQFIPTSKFRMIQPTTFVRIFLVVMALLALPTAAFRLNAGSTASAARIAPAAVLLSFDVDRTDDDATATACTAAANDCSLRGAIIAANASAGPDAINLQTGATYALSLGPSDSNSGNITPATGDLDITDELVINGNGSTVDAAGVDRIFQIERSPLANFTVTINDLTITGGVARGNLSSGGGIHVRAATLNLNNCVVTNNETALEGSPTATRDAGGGIVANGVNLPSPIAATVNLTNCTVSNNTGLSGGIATLTRAAVTINGSTITGNTATGSGGGLALSGAASTASITGSTFTGNSAAISGGGISVLSSTLTGGFNRIVGNTAPTDSGVTNTSGSVTMENNWWGCNYGPGMTGSGCAATPNGVSATVDSTPWLVLNLTANPTTINVGQTSALTATLTINSDNADTSGGGTIPDGITVSFNGTLGTVAPPSATTVSGTAGSTFTGTTGGSGGGSATVDGQTANAPIDINEAPTITCPGNIVVNAPAGDCSTIVNYPAPTVTGVPTPSISCSPSSGSTFSAGTTTVNCTATNSAGSSSCSFTVTVNDGEPPTLMCQNITASLPLNSSATTAVVNYNPVATDNCSGVGTPICSPPSGSSFPVGTTTVNCSVSDASNNTANCSFTVTVRYNFAGFFSPVANPPSINVVNAGRTVPVKFSLSGDKGLDIFAPGYPVSATIACDFTGPINDVEGIETPGGSSLTYNAGSDQYHFNWKTEKSWAGTCRKLILQLKDGTTHEAYLQFK